MHVDTALSVWELVIVVSEHLARMSQENTREARTPFEVVEVRAPGLTCTIRRSRDASFFTLITFCQALSPDLEDEYCALASQIPALEPPLWESYATPAAWFGAVVEHRQMWSAWRTAHPDDWQDAYHHACDRQRQLAEAHQQPRKTFTVAVGHDGRTPRMPSKFLRSLRRVETARFTSERLAPLEEALANDKLIVRLKAQRKFEEAAALEVSTQRLVAQMGSCPDEVKRRRRAREPWGWKTLWIDPVQTPRDDVRFVLVVYLLQEQMGEITPDIANFLQQYMGQFRHAASREARVLLQRDHARFRLQGGGEGLAAILRTFAEYEDWKALRLFVAKTLSGLWRIAARQEAEQSGQRLEKSLRTDGLYTVDDVGRILTREAHEDEWTPPSRDWFDDRMKEGTLLFALDAQGWKCLDENGLQCARKLVKDTNQRRALVDYQIDALGKSRRAANKYLQEHTARGDSLEDITGALLAQGTGTLQPKQQRGSHT